MIIEKVMVNKKKKSLEIDTPKGHFSLPFSKLRLEPTDQNGITRAYIDRELGNEAITYCLENGKEDSIHLDAFLDYNKDPEYMAKLSLYKLTRTAMELVKEARISKREIARKLKTSPAQLYRLLDTTNYSKTIDQMIKLLAALGREVSFVLNEDPPSSTNSIDSLRTKFPHLREEDIESTPRSTVFKPLLSDQRLAA